MLESALAWALVLGALTGLAARPTAAQPGTRVTAARHALVAATEERLWTARIEQSETLLSYRDRNGQPVWAEPLKTRIVSLTAAGQQVYAFQADGSFYRYADDWMPAIDLPGRRRPVDMVALEGVPYALLAGEVAADLPAYDVATSAPASRPFGATAAPLALIRYDQLGWSAVAPAPVEVGAEQPHALRPRLCDVRGKLMLFWLDPAAARLVFATFEPAGGQWTRDAAALDVPRLTAFWVAVVNRLPTLVLTTGADTAAELHSYRLVGEAAGHAWERGSLELSPLPSNAPAAAEQPYDACGFNQHLGVAVSLPDGSAYLRFGRFEGPATMGTIDLLARPPQNALPAAFQALRAAIMLSILLALFIFRRGSLTAPFPLARGQMPAFVLQRLAAALIDLLPFTAAAAVVLHLNWAAAVSEVVSWAIDPQAASRGLPPVPLLYWLMLSASGYVTYSLIMELLVGRTVGKLLLGMRVVTEHGQRAGAGRIIIRNLFRLIEILPWFWILAFVLVLSRNRQRVGDVFARTAVVRSLPVSDDAGGVSSEDDD